MKMKNNQKLLKIKNNKQLNLLNKLNQIKTNKIKIQINKKLNYKIIISNNKSKIMIIFKIRINNKKMKKFRNN